MPNLTPLDLLLIAVLARGITTIAAAALIGWAIVKGFDLLGGYVNRAAVAHASRLATPVDKMPASLQSAGDKTAASIANVATALTLVANNIHKQFEANIALGRSIEKHLEMPPLEVVPLKKERRR